jgi:hypothetical protein
MVPSFILNYLLPPARWHIHVGQLVERFHKALPPPLCKASDEDLAGYIYIYIYMYLCVCVCVCVCERERESVCVNVCVCVCV